MLALRAQRVHRRHQGHQVGGVVQIGTSSPVWFRAWASMLAPMRMRPRPRSISSRLLSGRGVKLRRERAAHIGQGGKGADDQRHRRR